MSEEIDRWVAYMKAHPKEWKKRHSEFINAQYQKSMTFIQRLAETPGGKEKIINAYHIKNFDGYARLIA